MSLPARAGTDGPEDGNEANKSNEGRQLSATHVLCCSDSRATRMHYFFIKVFPICHRRSTFGHASPRNNSNSPKRDKNAHCRGIYNHIQQEAKCWTFGERCNKLPYNTAERCTSLTATVTAVSVCL